MNDKSDLKFTDEDLKNLGAVFSYIIQEAKEKGIPVNTILDVFTSVLPYNHR